MKEFIEKSALYQYLIDRTEQFSLIPSIKFGIDILLAIVLLVLLYKILKVKIKRKVMYLYIILVIAFLVLLTFFELSLTLVVLKWILFWTYGVIIIIYSQNIKNFIDNHFRSVKQENTFESKETKKLVVDTLCKTSEWLSRRKVGALIVIERSDSLNSYIDKAIVIEGLMSQELLTSLFTEGNATHDGAVILRKQIIMCAGAYLPSTDKLDVPKSLGTRHRAAIGISEKTDALTIVVSEETGQISLTFEGAIEQNVTIDRLRERLDEGILTQKK